MRMVTIAVAGLASATLAAAAVVPVQAATPRVAPAEVTNTVPADISSDGAIAETLAQSANEAPPLGVRKPAGKRWSLGKASFFLVFADGQQSRVEDFAIDGEIYPDGPCMAFDLRGAFTFTTKTPGGLAYMAGDDSADGMVQVVASIYNRTMLKPPSCEDRPEVIGADSAQLSVQFRDGRIFLSGSKGKKLCTTDGCNAGWFSPIHPEIGIPLTPAIKRQLSNRNVTKVTLQFDAAERQGLQTTEPQAPCYDVSNDYSRCSYKAFRKITITLVRTDINTYQKAMKAHLKTLN